jgi:hypothetical protein
MELRPTETSLPSVLIDPSMYRFPNKLNYPYNSFYCSKCLLFVTSVTLDMPHQAVFVRK